MPVERRGQVIALKSGQPATGGTRYSTGRRQPSRGGTSRMTRECQVRICERLGVQFPGPTRQFPGPTRQNENSPILGLCQLLPPAPDIGLPMLPPPCANNGREHVQQACATEAHRNLLNDFVGADEYRCRGSDAKHLGRLEIDEQLNFRRLLHWQVGWLLALENPACVDASQTIGIRKTASVTHQTSGCDERARLIDCRYPIAERQCGELFVPISEECICADHEAAGSQFSQRCEDGIDVSVATGMEQMELQPKEPCGSLQISR